RAVTERELRSPALYLPKPRLRPRLYLLLVQLLLELSEHGLQRTDDGNVCVADLRDLRRIDVEMHDGCPGGERGHLAGDAIVEARADRDDQIRLVQGPVRPLRPVHAWPAGVQLVRLG